MSYWEHQGQLSPLPPSSGNNCDDWSGTEGRREFKFSTAAFYVLYQLMFTSNMDTGLEAPRRDPPETC